MPRIRRHNLPPHLLDHLLDRVSRRNISADQLGLMADWLRTEPEVPDGPWFKKFSGRIPRSRERERMSAGQVRVERKKAVQFGKGELIKTFLQPGQVATGKELT